MMPTSMTTTAETAEAWAGWTQGMAAFSRMLDRQSVDYLTFSKVACLDFCPQRYLLQYVEQVPLNPEPGYFLRGRVFHEAAANLHRARQRGRLPAPARILPKSLRELSPSDRTYIGNAIELMRRRLPADAKVIAVEEGFVLDLGPGLPPCLGIVDLVERQGDVFAVIDHKGGTAFHVHDPLQLLLYRRHVQHTYGARQCRCLFDEYRWVKNLNRIRRPAASRTEPVLAEEAWDRARRRLATVHTRIREIAHTGTASPTGDCRRCPYRPQCPKEYP